MAKRGVENVVANPRLLFSFLGVSEGLVWWAVDPFGLESLRAARLGIALLFLISSAALAARFTWDGSSLPRWIGVSSALGIVAAAVTWRVWGQLPSADVPYGGDEQRLAAWLVGSFVFLYVTVPFAQIFQHSGQVKFPYSELFEHSWNNFFVGLVSVLFVGVFWALLGVWGALFNVVGISLFSDLFQSKPFAYVSIFTMFGYGLALGRANEAVIRTLRRITLMIAHALLPFVALVAVLFVSTLPFTGMAPLWETGSATPLVLSLLGLLTLFLNGVFEDGEHRLPYPKLLLRGVNVAIVTMPVFAGIALYSTSLRVRQYGLTPDRVYALLFVSIASLYAVGYAVAAVWRSSVWMRLLKPVNVGTALVLAGLAILVQLHPLDPLRLSANSQLARLRDQRVPIEDFDFATLRFRLGHYGWDALNRLEKLANHPEYEEMRAAIELVRAAEAFWPARKEPGINLSAVRFELSPRDLTIPPGLLEAFSQDRVDLGTGMCVGQGECLVLGADLDGDGAPEFCLLGGHNWWYSACYVADGEGFTRIGSLAYRGKAKRPSLQGLERTLATGPIRTSGPRYRDLELRDGVLELVPPGFTPSSD